MALKKSPPKRKKSPPRRPRVRETLKQQAERQFAKMRGRNRAGPIWLARHFERQNGRCAYCGIPMLLPPLRGRKTRDRRATLDHVLPLMRGGADSEANTVAACDACNGAKGNMTALAFRMSAFCIARQAFAATVPEPKPKKPVIVEVRKRPRTETRNG
jgi:5-methylcytosine-specific restriction endonuclease McrA